MGRVGASLHRNEVDHHVDPCVKYVEDFCIERRILHIMWIFQFIVEDFFEIIGLWSFSYILLTLCN